MVDFSASEQEIVTQYTLAEASFGYTGESINLMSPDTIDFLHSCLVDFKETVLGLTGQKEMTVKLATKFWRLGMELNGSDKSENSDILKTNEQQRASLRLGAIAQNVYVMANLGLPHWRAGNYTDTGLSHDDLVGAAKLGLVEAARLFDPRNGGFSNYATIWMDNEIHELIRQVGGRIVLPGPKYRAMKMYNRLEDEAIQRGDSQEELDENLLQSIASLKNSSESLQSLHDAVNVYRQISKADAVVGDNTIIEEALLPGEDEPVEVVALDKTQADELFIILNRFLKYSRISQDEYDCLIRSSLGMTSAQIAKTVGLTRQGVDYVLGKTRQNVINALVQQGWDLGTTS